VDPPKGSKEDHLLIIVLLTASFVLPISVGIFVICCSSPSAKTIDVKYDTKKGKNVTKSKTCLVPGQTRRFDLT
jgi:hypothetical protein